ncbi:MAG: hypothetical protein BM563_00620 [Bacteroidetes bacterium MedPE-SWsnd-G1]|nr:MAG: hypothetical protein BM563_00620 [Bacteroidetes bacterium MedPE-SWsnd-G1]
MITISDIATKANVSAGTVDRVLHNRGGVSEKTAERVRKIVKEHDFKINAVASSLANKKSRTIAVLIPDYSETNTFWKDTRLGVEKALEEFLKFGVKLEVFIFQQFDASSYEAEFQKLIESNPDGAIIAPTFRNETAKHIPKIEANKIPYIFINIDLDGFKNISFLGQQSYKSGYLAGKLMHVSLSKPAVIAVIQTKLNVENNQALSRRIQGFSEYFIKKDHPLELIMVNIDDVLDAEMVKNTLNLELSKINGLSGLFVPSSRASVFVNALNSDLLSKLEVVGFDGTEQNLNSLKEDRISFLISQQSFNQGYNAIKLMVDFLIEKKLPTSKMYSPIEILTKENI